MDLSNLHITSEGLVKETSVRAAVLLEVQIELRRIADPRTQECALMVIDLMVRNEKKYEGIK